MHSVRETIFRRSGIVFGLFLSFGFGCLVEHFAPQARRPILLALLVNVFAGAIYDFFHERNRMIRHVERRLRGDPDDDQHP